MRTLLRAAFAYDCDKVSDDTAVREFSESMADQSQREDADINTLIKRFGLTGEMPILERVPLDMDFQGNMDYQESLNAVIAADEQFMSLPADLRARFNHKAGAFVKFCSDEANLPELEKLGLLRPKAEVVPPLEVVVKGGALDVPEPLA